MAPILSKFVKCKTGRKIPIDESNVRAIVNITKSMARNVTVRKPVKYFPRPGEDKNDSLSEENDAELQELLAQCPQPAGQQPETASPDPDQYIDLYPCPSPSPNQPGPSHQNNDSGENPPESIFVDGLDPVLEPNMTLKDVTEGQRAQILMYPGSDKEKRRLFFMEHYMEYYRYYELFDCWNECFITSKLP